MKVRIKGHIEARMAERKIGRHQVREAVEDPDSTFDTPRGSRCFVKQFGRHVLHVWVLWPPRDGDLHIVKSAAWKGGRR